MKQHSTIFCLILFLLQQRTVAKKFTNVVSHVFCDSSLSAEDKLDKNALEEVHTYAELKQDPRASLPYLFTVCSTIMTTSCRANWPIFFNILENRQIQFMAPFRRNGQIKSAFGIDFSQSTARTAKKERIGEELPPIFPNQWIRNCMAVNTTSMLIQWVVDGTLILAKEFEELKKFNKSSPKNLANKVVLGARSWGGSHWFAASHKVTNLNIFSSFLSIKKMKEMTTGWNCGKEGDYLAWTEMKWILHGRAKLEKVEMEETCQEKPLVDIFHTPFPDGMESCMHHCEKLGTRAPSVSTFEEWILLENFLKRRLYEKGLNTLDLWLPVQYKDEEREWRDFSTGKKVQNFTIPWMGSKANGGLNCVRLNGVTWVDVECDGSSNGCMCLHRPSAYIKLRGLCPSSAAIDVYYKPMNVWSDSRKLILQGLKSTSIQYDEKLKMWILNVGNSNVTGISKASFASFTLGKHKWTIEGDMECNETGNSYVTELKMSGCQEGEFTCNDGQCMSMDLRCNQLHDCRDESDEMSCDILVLKAGYNKKVPPVKSTDPVNVSVSIDLLKLVDIDEEDYSIEIQFEIALMWKERRAMYQNLKKRDSLNSLSEKDIDSLWLPKVIYENTDQKDTTRLGDNWEWETKVVVRRRQENGTLSGLDSVDETEIFKGSENSLVMNQTYTHNFQCNFELSYYPFDTQVTE